MSGSSVNQETSEAQQQEVPVRIVAVGHEWMSSLVGYEGRAIQTRKNENTTAVLVEGIPTGPYWLRAEDLQRIETGEESAA